MSSVKSRIDAVEVKIASQDTPLGEGSYTFESERDRKENENPSLDDGSNYYKN